MLFLSYPWTQIKHQIPFKMSQQQQQLRGQRPNSWSGMMTRLEYTKRCNILALTKQRMKKLSSLQGQGQGQGKKCSEFRRQQGKLFHSDLVNNFNKYTIIPYKIKFSEEIALIEQMGITYPFKQARLNALILQYNDEYCMDKSTQAEYMILLLNFYIKNDNPLFKCHGMKYFLPDLKWNYNLVIQTLTYLKEVDIILTAATAEDWEIDTLTNSYVNYTTLNHLEIIAGILECTLFIEAASKHMAHHREKMVAVLPRLLGHSVDCNVATIIYDFCL